MNTTKIQMAIVTNIGVIAEFIVSLLLTKIIHFLGGLTRAIGLVILVTSIQYFAISFNITYWLFFCAQMSTGLLHHKKRLFYSFY